MADVQPILDQIDRAVEKWESLRRSASSLRDLPSDLVYESFTTASATLRRMAPPGSAYLDDASNALERAGDVYQLPGLIGILKALRADYEAGYLQTLHELVHADIFGDFLEMADHLLSEGYKDPSAVLAGGVLEEHLRKLADKSGISTQVANRPKKADMLNSELAKGNIYSKLDQKNVTAWLDLRNKAAHGQYSGYTQEQVALMIQAARDFISRNPA